MIQQHRLLRSSKIHNSTRRVQYSVSAKSEKKRTTDRIRRVYRFANLNEGHTHIFRSNNFEQKQCIERFFVLSTVFCLQHTKNNTLHMDWWRTGPIPTGRLSGPSIALMLLLAGLAGALFQVPSQIASQALVRTESTRP